MIICAFCCTANLMISIIGIFTVSLYADLDSYCSKTTINSSQCDITNFYKTNLSVATGYIFIPTGLLFAFITIVFIIFYQKGGENESSTKNHLAIA